MPFNDVLNHKRACRGWEGTRGEKRGDFQWLVTPPQNLSSNHRGVMKKVLAVIFWGVLVFPAIAEEKPKTPDFVPFVVDQTQYQAVMQYLGGLKFNDAAPVVKWLNELEERAKGQWEADHRVDKP